MTNPMTNIDSKKKEMEEKARSASAAVADSLEAAADTVRSAADDSVHKINDLANQAGKKLDSTATCVRSWGGGSLFRGLRRKVNRNPLQSLAVAAAVGLVAGVSWKTTR
jgi:ElaB/YqjD/DUF883 family membrane-anchored ribosome-binding protein